MKKKKRIKFTKKIFNKKRLEKNMMNYAVPKYAVLCYFGF
jgi:hypothetical protein